MARQVERDDAEAGIRVGLDQAPFMNSRARAPAVDDEHGAGVGPAADRAELVHREAAAPDVGMPVVARLGHEVGSALDRPRLAGGHLRRVGRTAEQLEGDAAGEPRRNMLGQRRRRRG